MRENGLRVTQIRVAALLDRSLDHEPEFASPRGPRLSHALRRQALRYVHGLAKPLRLWARSIVLAAGLAVAYFLAARTFLPFSPNLMASPYSGLPPVLPLVC